MTGKSFNCQMDITFHHTRDGRPELYDFLWEHLPQLAVILNEKKMRLTVQPPASFEKWSKLTGMNRVELEHVIRKMEKDTRLSMPSHAGEKENPSSLEITILTKKLDHVLSSYNIFLERFLPYLSFEGKNIRIDFSPAEKNMVKCYAFSNQKPLINTFLVRNLIQPPRVRSVIFASFAERRRSR